MTTAEPADESRWYTVVRGDTLSAISKSQYGTYFNVSPGGFRGQYPEGAALEEPAAAGPDKPGLSRG